jgi:DNA-binding NarL/FixJ family response regulator
MSVQTMDQRSKDPGLIAPLRALVADDRPIVFNGVDTPRAGEREGGHATDASGVALAIEGNVAVLDLSAPGLDGLEAARRFLATSPDCRVLAITAQDDSAYLRQLLELGVAGYVSKRSSALDLLQGIQTVGQGGLYCDPMIAGRAQARAASQINGSDRGTVAELSTREIEVLKLAAAGHSNKTIAAKLQIGSKSVETYKARGMAKLGFHTRVEVVRFALSLGWLSEP